jgi:hypothetical protein
LIAGPGFAKRLKRAAAFVAIVWGVAATFVVFEVLALGGMDVVVSYQDLFGKLLLSPAITESKTCVVEPDDRAGAAGGGLRASDARAASWLLGVVLGRDASLRQFSTSNPETLAALSAGREQFAGDLGVPAPDVFVPRQLANANSEFVAFVEADGRDTAHQLAIRHSPQACQLYKLGAVWGYSEIVRLAIPDARAVHAVEIRHYAQQANLPDELWRPMVAGTPRGAVKRDPASDSALTNGITKFLTDQP